MLETELVICHLRDQVRQLHSLVQFLDVRDTVLHEDCAYLQVKLHEVIGRLRAMEKFSSQRGTAHTLRAAWLN